MVFLFAALGASAQNMPERSEVRRGNRQYNKGNYEKSIERYERALGAAPESFEAIYNLGNALYKAERFDKAEQTMRKAAADSLRADGERAEAFYNLGNAQFKQQKYKEALESYKQSLRLNPDDQEAKYNYAYTKRLLDENKDGGGGGNDDQNQDKDQNQDQQQQRERTPLGVTTDLPETERQVPLGLHVVNRLRRRVDLKRRHFEVNRIARPERVDDILVGIQHGGPAEVPFTLFERRQRVAFAQFEVAAVAFERVDRVFLVQFDGTSRLVLELGKLHHLHQILVHVDHQVEPVADQDAVGRYVRRYGRNVGLCLCGGPHQEQ